MITSMSTSLTSQNQRELKRPSTSFKSASLHRLGKKPWWSSVGELPQAFSVRYWPIPAKALGRLPTQSGRSPRAFNLRCYVFGKRDALGAEATSKFGATFRGEQPQAHPAPDKGCFGAPLFALV